MRHIAVRTNLSKEEADELVGRTPSELVRGTPHQRDWLSRGFAAERITDGAVQAEDVADPLWCDSYALDLFDLYARMWAIGVDRGDGTRLFQPTPGTREALKWLIEDLSGAPAEVHKTLRENNDLRRQAHARLLERGWADRINQTSFLLLRDPDRIWATVESVDMAEATDLTGPVDEGETIVDVSVDDVTGADDRLTVGDRSWSEWRLLADAVSEATTSPGVYIARSGKDLVYVGKAGERRGQGVRGRLQVYARGRAAVSGLGEAALDRALADPAWLASRLASLHTDGPARAQQWARDALTHAKLEICWTAAPDSTTARDWEAEILQQLEDVALWNRARPKPGATER